MAETTNPGQQAFDQVFYPFVKGLPGATLNALWLIFGNIWGLVLLVLLVAAIAMRLFGPRPVTRRRRR